MSETKWTPGPWPITPGDGKRLMVGRGLVEGPDGYEVAEVYSDDCPSEVAWANANLIASAPDLYDCLQAAVDIIGHPDDPMTQLFVATLAKARGES